MPARLQLLAVAGLKAAGAALLLHKAKDVVFSPLWHYWLRPKTSFKEFRGDWAVITGASRGLGRGYALALARRGLNVLLLARDGARLEAVAAECEEWGVKARFLVADFSEDPLMCITEELSRLDGDVSVVINCVGGRPTTPRIAPVPCYCEDLDGRTFTAFFRFNVLPAVAMMRLVLRGMVRRDRGYVLNVSSVNGLQACPYLAPYSAAKAHVFQLSACIANELKSRGSRVCVEAVCPGPLATDGIRRAGFASNSVPDPCIFAERSLALARSAFADVPWPAHWWTRQWVGPHSHLLPHMITERRLCKAMDFSRFLGQPK